jgi:ABC-type Fe3+-siderophore transport system permease subunit
MSAIDEQSKTTESTNVFPALIHIQGVRGVLPTGEPQRRRITALIDHPVSRQLGTFSWILVILALAVRRPLSVFLVGAVVFIGLVIGLINAARWLFEKQERRAGQGGKRFG